MGRWIVQMASVIYLLTVPPGVYAYLSANSTGYPTKAGGLLVLALSLSAIVLVCVVQRVTATPTNTLPESITEREHTAEEHTTETDAKRSGQ